MNHVALYRQWRPRTFDEIVEQSSTVAALRQAVISQKISHAYLFSGTRGTGKTTIAQIFSRAINCLSPLDGNPCNLCTSCKDILSSANLDVIEMDAASNNSVDTIRKICDEVVFTPASSKYKVYIIDEVHMLSTGAFNALLKTLEEPPSHAVFILATTEPHRIPATIISRCQRYEFKRISLDAIISRLDLIAHALGIKAEPLALSLIARIADGALRDAISLFDQAISVSQDKNIKEADVLSLVGMVTDDFLYEIVSALIYGNVKELLTLIDRFIMNGKDVNRLTIDLTEFYRNLLLIKVSADLSGMMRISEKSLNDLKSLARVTDIDYIINAIHSLSLLASDLKRSLNPRITFEASMISLCSPKIRSSETPSGQKSSSTPDFDISKSIDKVKESNKTVESLKDSSETAAKSSEQNNKINEPLREKNEIKDNLIKENKEIDDKSLKEGKEVDDMPLNKSNDVDTSHLDSFKIDKTDKTDKIDKNDKFDKFDSINKIDNIDKPLKIQDKSTIQSSSDSEISHKNEEGEAILLKVREILAGNNNFLLYLYLENAKAFFEDNILSLSFEKIYYHYYNDLSSPENISEITSALAKITGKDTKISLLLEE